MGSNELDNRIDLPRTLELWGLGVAVRPLQPECRLFYNCDVVLLEHCDAALYHSFHEQMK